MIMINIFTNRTKEVAEQKFMPWVTRMGWQRWNEPTELAEWHQQIINGDIEDALSFCRVQALRAKEKNRFIQITIKEIEFPYKSKLILDYDSEK